MRSVTITRRKSFVGIAIPYFLFVGCRKPESLQADTETLWDFPNTSDGKIHNGQTVTISIPNHECGILVCASTSTGTASSPVYSIDKGTADLALELITKYSWIHGSRLMLKPLASRSSDAG